MADPRNLATKFHALLSEMAKFRKGDGNVSLSVFPGFLASLTPEVQLTNQSTLIRFVQVSLVPDRLIEALKYAGRGSLYGGPIRYLEKARDLFTLDALGNAWINLQQQIDDAMLVSLESAADALSPRDILMYTEAQSTALREARSRIVDLIADLQAADAEIDESIRTLLLWHLEAILEAIDLTPWIGESFLAERYHETVGKFFVNGPPGGFVAETGSPLGRVWARFRSILSFVGDASGPIALTLTLTAGAGPDTVVVFNQPTVNIDIDNDDDVIDGDIVPTNELPPAPAAPQDPELP